MRVPMLNLRRHYEHVKDGVDRALATCLEHQRWILGPEVAELEKGIALLTGSPHAVAVSSGTDALVLALRALALKTKGAEFFDRTDGVLTTPFTFTATGDAILRAGATPVFADIDPVSFNLDPDAAARAAGAAGVERIVGMAPVHLFGLACDMDALGAVAAKNGWFVLEDAAQSLGGAWRGRMLGSIGDAGALSFFPSKNLGGFGDGGMVLASDDGVAATVRVLLKHGGRDKYNVDTLGYNARLDTIQAAVLCAKLPCLEDFNERRRALAAVYGRGLAGAGALRLPVETPGARHVYHQYTVRVGGGKRDALQGRLKEAGIDSMVYYPVCLHTMKLFAGRSAAAGSLAAAEEAVREVLSLPMDPLMTPEEAAYVVDRVNAFAG